MPVMRPLFLEFPEDEITYTTDGQWMVGAALLVAPVTNRGQTSVHVYLPAGSAQAPVGFWYDLETLQQLTAGSREVQAPLDKLPVFVRGGSIVPRKLRLRRSAKLMRHDPYTLVVAPGAGGGAEGLLYLDDEETLAHEVAGRFALRQLRFAGGVLSCSAAEPLLGPSVRAASVGTGTPQVTLASDFASISTVERLLLAGQTRAPTGATLRYTVGGESVTAQLPTTYDRGVVTVKKPDVLVTQDWTITLDF
jgi:alpha 1,3-glucosidase